MKNVSSFVITRVITRDVVRDSFNSIRNFFGMRLRNFEDKIMINYNEMVKEMNLKYAYVVWFRASFNPLVNGSCMINIYGEYKK